MKTEVGIEVKTTFDISITDIQRDNLIAFKDQLGKIEWPCVLVCELWDAISYRLENG
jgi:hypothetical protein